MHVTESDRMDRATRYELAEGDKRYVAIVYDNGDRKYYGKRNGYAHAYNDSGRYAGIQRKMNAAIAEFDKPK